MVIAETDTELTLAGLLFKNVRKGVNRGGLPPKNWSLIPKGRGGPDDGNGPFIDNPGSMDDDVDPGSDKPMG